LPPDQESTLRRCARYYFWCCDRDQYGYLLRGKRIGCRRRGTYRTDGFLYRSHVFTGIVPRTSLPDGACFGYCARTYPGGAVYDYVGGTDQFRRYDGGIARLPHHRDDAICL